MNGEDKYTNLRLELKDRSDWIRRGITERLRRAKWSYLIVTVLLLLLLLIKSTDKVGVMLIWVAAMLVISGYVILLAFFDGDLTGELDTLSEKYEETYWRQTEEEFEEPFVEEPFVEEPFVEESFVEYSEEDTDRIIAEMEKVVADK